MKKKYKKIWTRALLSEEYKQGRGSLCKQGKKGDKFCCLGVIYNELAKRGLVDPWVPSMRNGMDPDGTKRYGILKNNLAIPYIGREQCDGYEVVSAELAPDILPPPILDKIGLDFNEMSKLVDLNDSGESFESIAAWVEDNL